jgi:hypothetical protein
MTTMTALAFALMLGSTSLAACADDPAGPGPDDGEDGLPAAALEPVGSHEAAQPPAELAIDGVYALESTLTVEAAALLPGSAYEAVQTLEGLRDHPAETLFDLAEQAGVPAVGTLRDALPSALESRINGWIDDEIRGLTTGDGSLALVIDGVVTIAHAEVGLVRLGSRLVLDDGRAVHRLDTVGLDVLGRAMAFDVAPLAAIGAELEVPVTAAIVHQGGAATVTLGAHGFGLPYGRIAWRALDELVIDRYGRDLRALLGDQVQCDAIAAAVADRCLLGVCVGHESELRAICEAGLDRAVAELQQRVEAQTIEPVALDAGQATLADGAPRDGHASTIEGTWDARLDLGQGLRPAPATFTGSRE